MTENMDRKSKELLWFLFQPEASGEIEKLTMNRGRAGRSLTPMDTLRETLKSVVWICASILLSLTLAQLN